MIVSKRIPPVVFLLLALFLAQGVFLAFTNSTVSDEVAHIPAGYTYLKYHDFKINPEHPPLAKQIAAIPLMFMDLKFPDNIPAWKDGDGEQWELGRTFLYRIGNPAEKIIFYSRLALLPLALILGLALFFWIRELIGEPAAIFAVFLYSYFPEMIIHASLVTTDFAGAVFHFTAFYCLYMFFKYGSRRFLFAAGVSGGFALLSKFSMLQILPLFYFFSLIIAFFRSKDTEPLPFSIPVLALITFFTVFHVTSVLIFAAPVTFFWVHRFFPRLPVFRHPKIRTAMSIVLVLLSISFLIVALGYFEPALWFKKFRPFKRFFRGWAIFRDHSIKMQHPGFLLGERSVKGWWYYYLLAMLVKIPIAVWILSLLGAAAALTKRYFSKIDWVFLLVPPLAFLFIASFINKVNIGVRHVLPVYPYLLVFAAAGFHFLWITKKTFISRSAAVLLSLWVVISSALAFPNYLTYFNEFAAAFGGSYNILNDSNISWGQDLKRLKVYVDKSGIPEVKTILMFNFPDELDYYKIHWVKGEQDFKERKPGVYVLDVFNYYSMIKDKEYAWLKNKKPDAKVGGSLWIYKL